MAHASKMGGELHVLAEHIKSEGEAQGDCEDADAATSPSHRRRRSKRRGFLHKVGRAFSQVSAVFTFSGSRQASQDSSRNDDDSNSSDQGESGPSTPNDDIDTSSENSDVLDDSIAGVRSACSTPVGAAGAETKHLLPDKNDSPPDADDTAGGNDPQDLRDSARADCKDEDTFESVQDVPSGESPSNDAVPNEQTSAGSDQTIRRSLIGRVAGAFVVSATAAGGITFYTTATATTTATAAGALSAVGAGMAGSVALPTLGIVAIASTGGVALVAGALGGILAFVTVRQPSIVSAHGGATSSANETARTASDKLEECMAEGDRHLAAGDAESALMSYSSALEPVRISISLGNNLGSDVLQRAARATAAGAVALCRLHRSKEAIRFIHQSLTTLAHLRPGDGLLVEAMQVAVAAQLPIDRLNSSEDTLAVMQAADRQLQAESSAENMRALVELYRNALVYGIVFNGPRHPNVGTAYVTLAASALEMCVEVDPAGINEAIFLSDTTITMYFGNSDGVDAAENPPFCVDEPDLSTKATVASTLAYWLERVNRSERASWARQIAINILQGAIDNGHRAGEHQAVVKYSAALIAIHAAASRFGDAHETFARALDAARTLATELGPDVQNALEHVEHLPHDHVPQGQLMVAYHHALLLVLHAGDHLESAVTARVQLVESIMDIVASLETTYERHAALRQACWSLVTQARQRVCDLGLSNTHLAAATWLISGKLALQAGNAEDASTYADCAIIIWEALGPDFAEETGQAAALSRQARELHRHQDRPDLSLE